MSGKRKRSSDSIRSPPDANQAQPPQAQPQAGPASKRTAPRRPKSSQACQACRKHKTRCELLDSTTYVARCHRCEVLSITCSFETDAPRSVVFNDPRPLNKGRQSAAKALLAPSKHPASPGSTPGARNGEGGADPDNTEDETESPWDFLTVPGLADWTDTPILGMRMLMRQTSPDPFPKFSGAVSSLSEVITPEQKHFLLERFAQQYEPWLSLPPNALVEDDMLDLVRCTVASRHLDPLTRSQVFPALRYLVEQVIMQHVFNPSPSIAVVQAFCILSLWSPFESLPPSAGSHDSRLIASSAVSMGKTLRLNESEDRALELQQRLVKGSRLTIEEANEYPLLMTNCSMWVLLRVVESMACIGTGRPLTATSDVELDMKRYGHISDTLDSARHTRLLLFGRIFELADKGVRIELPGSQDDYDAFYDGVEELLTRFEVLSRVILGLPVSSEFDKFYLESFSVFYQFCKLVVYVRILRLLRVNQPKTLQNNPYLLAKWRRHGSTQVIRSARSAMLASDAMLVAVLSTHEPDLLASAPDAFFSMVAFAAAFLVMAKFMLLITQGQRRIPGCTDQLLTRVVRLLGRVAPSPDHPAARCAKIMTGFIETWDARLVAYDAEHAQPNPGELLPAPRDGMGTLQPENGSNGGSSNNLPHAVQHQGHTYSHVNGQQPPPMTTGPSTSFIPPNVQLASSVPPIPMPELTDFSFRYDSASLSGFGGGGDVFGGDFWQFMAELPGAGVGAGAGAGAGGGLGDLNYMYQTQAPPQ